MTGRDPIIDMQPCTEAEFMARLNGYAERFPEIAAWGTGARASYESAQLLEGAVHRSRIMTKRLLRQKPCRRFTRRKVNSGLPRAVWLPERKNFCLSLFRNDGRHQIGIGGRINY
jgi:hypothetical protein